MRAWDSANNKMITHDFPYIGVGSGALDVAVTLSGKVITPNSYGLDYGFTSPPPELIIMLYTGYDDKNGKKVFVGDKIKSGETGLEYEVVLKNGRFFGDRPSMILDVRDFPNSEITGNIYTPT